MKKSYKNLKKASKKKNPTRENLDKIMQVSVTGMGGFPPTNSGGNKVFVAATRICLSQKIRSS